jgi:hypothetical protein
MARVRARLMGYEDDNAGGEGEGGVRENTDAVLGDTGLGGGRREAAGPAARAALAALLEECSCREERAQALAEACVPPGLAVGGGSRGSVRNVLTSPGGLLAAIAETRAASTLPSSASICGGSGGSSGGSSGVTDPLPSGEALADALAALEEDVGDYDMHVYSRLSPLERFGGPGFM